MDEERCANCDTPLAGDYCHACGQQNKNYLRNVFSLIGEFLQDFANWDSRLLRTMVPLMFRPGFLSREYVGGRRAKYVPPVRLYLFISLFFFLAISLFAKPDTSEWQASIAEQERVALERPDRSIAEAVREGAASGYAAGRGTRTEGGSTGVRVQGMDTGQGTLEERVDVNLPFFSDEMNDQVKQQLIRVVRSPDLLYNQARVLAPLMMFLLLPLFALLLKVLYPLTGRYYTEHLTLALHTHSFLFVSFLVLMALGASGTAVAQALIVLLLCWMPIYLFLAQKWFYGQGWFLTTFKYMLTSSIYFTMMSFGFTALLIASIVTA